MDILPQVLSLRIWGASTLTEPNTLSTAGDQQCEGVSWLLTLRTETVLCGSREKCLALFLLWGSVEELAPAFQNPICLWLPEGNPSLHISLHLPYPPLQSSAAAMDLTLWQYQFRIIMLGDSTVGKSSLLKRYTEEMFLDCINQTVGVDFYVHFLEVEPGVRVKLQFWDTAGQERFR